MKIFVRGKNECLSKKEVKAAAAWYASKLMTARLLRNIELTVRFVEDCKTEIGNTIYLDEDSSRPREFEIHINPHFKKNEQLSALAHEMVHLKQFARRELVHSRYGELKWPACKRQPKEYYEQPWEIEAYGREIGLFRRYQEHLKGTKVTRES